MCMNGTTSNNKSRNSLQTNKSLEATQGKTPFPIYAINPHIPVSAAVERRIIVTGISGCWRLRWTMLAALDWYLFYSDSNSPSVNKRDFCAWLTWQDLLGVCSYNTRWFNCCVQHQTSTWQHRKSHMITHSVAHDSKWSHKMSYSITSRRRRYKMISHLITNNIVRNKEGRTRSN